MLLDFRVSIDFASLPFLLHFLFVLFQLTRQNDLPGMSVELARATSHGSNSSSGGGGGGTRAAWLTKNPTRLLLKDLLEHYDLRVRPVRNYTDTVHVGIRLTLHLIRELVRAPRLPQEGGGTPGAAPAARLLRPVQGRVPPLGPAVLRARRVTRDTRGTWSQPQFCLSKKFSSKQ